MATVTKDFKIKYGLIVEGETGTINNYDILTKSTGDQEYISNLIGGTADSASVANTIVLRDGSANFAANTITADLVGDVTGQVSSISNFDTDDLGEGSTNQYFSNQRALDATSAAYDAAGAAGAVAGDLSTHEGLSSAHGVSGDIVGTTDSQTLSNKTFSDAVTFSGTGNFAVNGNSDIVLTPGSGYAVKWGSDILATQGYSDEYTDNAIAALANSAPELLDTLNELALAIGSDENFATTLTNLVATKQDILTEGTGIDITGNTISVDTVTIATVQYVDDVTTDDVEEGSTNLYFTNTRAQAVVDDAIDLIDTDAVEEGSTNLYYTNTRAKGDAAELLTTANLINISITGDENGLTIEAENGVADSDTDDLDEGSTNLYFTNARAVAALEAVTPVFTEVDLNSVALQVAGTLNVPSAGIATAYAFDMLDYRSAKFLVKIASGSHTDISEVLLTLDTSNNVAITEYAMVGTNGSLGSVSADINSGNVRLLVDTENNNSDVTVMGTLLV
jgi:hypothetical protein